MQSIDLEELTVSEIMSRWPATMRLFIDRHLLCVGCPISPFHRLTDVSTEHGVDHDELVRTILELVGTEPATAAQASSHRQSAPAREDRTP